MATPTKASDPVSEVNTRADTLMKTAAERGRPIRRGEAIAQVFKSDSLLHARFVAVTPGVTTSQAAAIARSPITKPNEAHVRAWHAAVAQHQASNNSTLAEATRAIAKAQPQLHTNYVAAMRPSAHYGG